MPIVLEVWDFLNTFSQPLGIAPMSLYEFGFMLSYPKLSPLTNEIHLCIVKYLFENFRQCLMYVEKDVYILKFLYFYLIAKYKRLESI